MDHRYRAIFSPIGADLNGAYRVVTNDELVYYLKQKWKFKEASVAVPNYFNKLGTQIIPPLTAKTGNYMSPRSFRIILIPLLMV